MLNWKKRDPSRIGFEIRASDDVARTPADVLAGWDMACSSLCILYMTG